MFTLGVLILRKNILFTGKFLKVSRPVKEDQGTIEMRVRNLRSQNYSNLWKEPKKDRSVCEQQLMWLKSKL